MTNAEMAVELAKNYFEAEDILVETSTLRELAEKWEKRLDPIDFMDLAAVMIANPPELYLTKQEIAAIRDFYFFSDDEKKR